VILRTAACAALLPLAAAAVLTSCSGLAAPDSQMPASGPDTDYQQVIANYLRATLKSYQSYESFEISEPRWVDSLRGWSWLTCVRFVDHGRSRLYATFLQSHKIVDGRFAVRTDNCDAQNYAPFGPLNSGLAPIH
jgi:hypothetical protein